MQIDQLLRDMIKAGGSDAHLKVGMPPGIRVAGRIYPRGETRLMPEHTAAAARELLDQEQWERFDRLGDIDCSYSRRRRGALSCKC